MPRSTLSRTMQADLKQAKSDEAGVESHIHIHTKYIRIQKVCNVRMFLFMARFYHQVSLDCIENV